MFEICESNPFDLLNKKTEHHGGKHISLINKNLFIYFLVLTLDSDDDFEVV
jgi:hypothetical protein